MQQSPCFKLYSPDETSKLFPSFQRYNSNGLYSPGGLFFNFYQNSSGQNSNHQKNLKIFPSSNTKQAFNYNNKNIFLSNKRNFTSESIKKKNKQNIYTNKNSSDNNTYQKNEETVFESQQELKKTKASSKKYSTYIPIQYYNGGNCNGTNNNGSNNIGFFGNPSLVKYNNNNLTYVGSVKKNLLPSLSKELKSNIKNKTSTKKNSCSKSSLNNSQKKTINDTTSYDYLCRTTESLDLDKMVDFIISSTKIYNKYNDKKEISTNNNKLANDIYNSACSKNKSNKKDNIKFNTTSVAKKNKINNSDNKMIYNLCKCKKVECLRYSCSCLKSGNKCSNLCNCINCKNKEENKFIIDSDK